MDKRSAIWLLGGWLLMQPPYLATPRADGVIDLDAMRAESEAPLSQWSQVRAFDTAEGCEAFREREKDKDKGRAAAKCVPIEAVYPALQK